MQIYLRAIGQDDLVTLDAPDDATIEDLIALIADDHSLSPASVRLVFNGRVISRTAAVSSLTSTASTPITFYGRPLPKAASPPPPPPPPPPTDELKNPAIEEFVAMGFDRGLSERALALAKGDPAVATELLLSQKVSEEGLREVLGPGPVLTRGAIIDRVLTDPGLLQKALTGDNLLLSVRSEGMAATLELTNAEIEAYVRQKYGCDLRGFVQSGGAQRAGGSAGLAAGEYQAMLDRLWLQKYERWTPQEKEKVEALRDLTTEIALIVQVIVGCGGNVDEARRVLEEIR